MRGEVTPEALELLYRGENSGDGASRVLYAMFCCGVASNARVRLMDTVCGVPNVQPWPPGAFDDPLVRARLWGLVMEELSCRK